MNSSKTVFYLLAMAWTGLGLGQTGNDPTGWDLLRQGDLEAARDVFLDGMDSGNPLENQLGTAWSAYLLGDLATAEITLLDLLAEEPAVVLKGHAHLLLGYVAMNWYAMVEAAGHLDQALAAYETAGDQAGVLAALTGKAAIGFLAGDSLTNAQLVELLFRAKQARQPAGMVTALVAYRAFMAGDVAQGKLLATEARYEWLEEGSQYQVALIDSLLVGTHLEKDLDRARLEILLLLTPSFPSSEPFASTALTRTWHGQRTEALQTVSTLSGGQLENQQWRPPNSSFRIGGDNPPPPTIPGQQPPAWSKGGRDIYFPGDKPVLNLRVGGNNPPAPSIPGNPDPDDGGGGGQ